MMSGTGKGRRHRNIPVSRNGGTSLADREVQLNERIKELKCLYTITDYFNRAGLDYKKALSKLPALLKRSWQYPRETVVRLTVDRIRYQSRNFKKTKWCQSADIMAGKRKRGSLEICYLHKMADEAEERDLINEIAVRIGKYITSVYDIQELVVSNRQLLAGEQQLRASNQQLRAGEQQLRALNQQLRATEQQLRASNQQLTASEARFRRLMENARDMIYRMSIKDGTYEYISPAAEQVTGYTADEWMESPGLIGTIIHPDYRDFFATEWEKLQKGIMSPTYEYKIIDKAGNERWLHQRNVLVKGKRGKPEYIEGIVTDLTAIKAAEEARESVLGQLTSLFNGIDDVIYVSDPGSYELLHVNDAFKKNWGTVPTGKKCYEVLQNRKAPCPFCTNPIIFKEKPGQTYVWEFQNEVTGRWYRCADKAIDWPDGRKVRFEIASDITERKEMEVALGEEKERFEVIFARSTVGKSLTAPDGTLLKINRAFAEMLGRTETEMLSLNFSEITHPDDIAESRECIRALLAGERKTYRMQKRYMHKNGSEVWTDVGTTLLRDEDGGPKYFITAILDVTKQHKDEERLKKTLEALHRSNQELEQFAYVASHDLQEPLRMVASYVELLADRYKGRLDEDADDFIGFAVDGATRMQNLIRDLLAFSRVTTKGGDFVPVDTGALIGNVLRSLETMVKETGAVVEVGDMPTVPADQTQLARVFQNLIQNAIKFTPENRSPLINIEAQWREGTWQFRVKDNGIGINREYFNKVFIIFQRLNRKSRYGGTGIGLSICKRIIERHGGRIWIESEPDQGSDFYFTIPAAGN